jgi:arginine utilization regulatory protein
MNTNQWQQIIYALTQELDYGVHVVLSDNTTVLYNQAMMELEEQSQGDVIGKDFRKVFSNIPEEESTLLRALRSGEATINREQRYPNKYGKIIHTVNSTVPVFGTKSEIVAAIELSKDVTNIMEMSDSLLALRNANNSKGEIPRDFIKKYTFRDLVGQNYGFREMIDLAKKASTSNTSVFISGATGTGKELIAQSIHYRSPRKDKPFLAQNCAALPESLLEGILFGTAQGGFTGALDREGLFEQASGGTLLLDEISSMPYALQGKLLRVLQEDYIRRVGGIKDIPIDVRILATVNVEPEQLLADGILRKDLYYRLNIINIRMPSLIERKEDIPLLVDHFLEKHNARFDKEVWMVSDKAMNILQDYNYPGNVRELENIIMSAVSLTDGEHVITDRLLRIPKEPKPTLSGLTLDRLEMPLDDYFKEIEKLLIKEALDKAKGNISQGAKALGIKRQTLQHKMKKYDLKGES